LEDSFYKDKQHISLIDIIIKDVPRGTSFFDFATLLENFYLPSATPLGETI
jgi:hypothetical protein